jgi:2',3'-cyclic-nucleotide 2'-phosphodiesterase (5'-nucleotidase family)/DNA-binding beta-propeller fold protein YncE
MADFTLELLHTADQEAGIPALDDAPNFSAVLNALKNQDLGGDGIEDNTLVLSSGDAIIPGLFFSASDEVFGGAGRADMLIQNELGFQAISFGNHEFDLGTGLLADLIGGAVDDPATPDVDESFVGAQFPYLSANLDFTTDANLAGFVVADAAAPQANSIAASTVIDVNGEKIGVVGATTPTIRIISSPGDVTIAPVEFDGNPTPAQLDALAADIQADVNALLAANPDVNKVVLLAHMQQLAIEEALAERLSNVDIIVGGGSNTRLFDDDDRPRDGDSDQGPYPIFKTGADGNPVAVVNTDGNYKYVGRLVVDFDENGVIDPSSYDATVSGAYATDAQGVNDLGAAGLVDPEIQAIVDALRVNIEAKESNVFGVSDVYLDGLRGSVRTQETNLGNLTADANLAIAREITGDDSIVVSLKNGGGIRDDIGQVYVPPGGTGDPVELPNEAIPGVKPEGGISETDIANSLRFNNGLTVLNITREGLVAVLEHGVAASSLDDTNTQGRFPQVSGVEFSFDLNAEAGDRIQSAAIKDADGTVLDVLVKDGEFVGDASQTVKIVTLNFLAGDEGDASGEGGDGYPFPLYGSNYVQLAQADEAPRTGEATFAPDGSEQDALAEYLFDNYLDTPFDQADTERDQDTRLQNLAFRADTVLPKTIGEVTALIPEASTADEAAEQIDGQSGDTDFPYGSFKALATVGEVDPNTGYALTGYPDGQAAWLLDEDTVRVAYQSESYGTLSSETYPWEMESGVTFTGSHIHVIDYNRAKFAEFLSNNTPASDMFEGSGFLFDTVYNVFGEIVDGKNSDPSDLSAKWGNQTLADGTLVEFIPELQLQGADFFFQSFCGAYYEKADKYGDGIGFEDDVWLTAEEWNIGRAFPNGEDDSNATMGLASMVVDIANETAYTVPALGQSGYEKLMPINPGHEDYVVIVASGYNHEVEPAPLKVYIGKKGFDASGNAVDQNDPTVSERDKFLARNGLLFGQLYGMAADAATYSALGLTVDADAKMMDEYLTNAEAPDNFSVRYMPTSYQWDGFDTPEAVKDTEVFLWTQDGDAVEGGTEANEQPDGYTFFNGDTKVEHPAVDPDITRHRYVQNMTDEGALLGIDFSNMLNDLNNDADGNGLPDYLSADVTRIIAAVDGALTLETGGKGVAHTGENNPDGTATAATHVEAGEAKMVAPDGLQWIKTADGDYLIVDEDSGNDYGERKYVLPIDAETLALEEPGKGYFLAQAGGSLSPRAAAEASAYGGTFSRATSAEFSGSWNVTGLVAKKADGSFYTQAELAGTGEQDVINTVPLAEQTLIGVVQMSGESGGAVAAQQADQGGQLFMFNIDGLGNDTPAEQPDFSGGFDGPFTKLATLELAEGAEINAFDKASQKLFVVSGEPVLQIVDVSNPTTPAALAPVDLSAYGDGINSVAVYNGLVAAAVESGTAGVDGQVVFLDTNGTVLNAVTVGDLPDMVTFTPDGSKLLVANEGEPNDDYSVDPEGSVSLIDLSNGVANAGVTTIEFTDYNDRKAELQAAGVRLFGLNATVAQDLEPEYIAVSPDGTTAWVTLQENNAVAAINIANQTLDGILPLGFKDFSRDAKLDASNRDDQINLQNWPVFGMYQPDSIASYAVDGITYYVTANEGDARIRPDGDLEDEAGNVILEEGVVFNEESRIKDVTLDPDAFPNAATLQQDENLGRLKITNTLGDTDGDGDFDELYAYGGRSFSIWDENGNLVFDSGDDIANITAQLTPDLFNANDGDPGEFDDRSDDKGAEPEALTIGQIGDTTYAFVGLERAGGGVLVYDISNPGAPSFVQYLRDDIDIAPEGLTFVSSEHSPNGKNLLFVTNEESSTLAIYEADAQTDIPGETPAVSGLLDLTGVDGTVTANVTLSREAAFDNLLQFYKTDAEGTVDGLKPGDAGYEDAVRANLLSDPTVFIGDLVTTDAALLLAGGTFYAPALLVNGNINNLVTIDDAVTDVNRIQYEGNTWRFEDAGDFDYDDLIFTLNSADVV